MDRFVEENGELLNRWEIMLDSMVIFTIAANKLAVEALGHPKDQHPVVDDLRYCGNNFVWLFGIEGFVEDYYQNVNPRNFRYFTRQFEEYMFDSANLFKYFWLQTIRYQRYCRILAQRLLGGIPCLTIPLIQQFHNLNHPIMIFTLLIRKMN